MIARLVLAAGLLAGCSLLAPPAPEPVKAVLSELPAALPHAARQRRSLVVLPPEAHPACDTVRMAYAERAYEIAYFRDHEWAEPPARMLHRLLVQALEQTGAFAMILTQPAPQPGAFTLRSELLALVQDVAVTPPILRLALRVELRGPGGRALASHEFALAQPMIAANADAGVVAANAAVANLLQHVAGFVLAHVR